MKLKDDLFIEPIDCYEIKVRPDGKVTDYLRKNKKALCRCIHGKVWEEGDKLEKFRGKACNKCSYK